MILLMFWETFSFKLKVFFPPTKWYLFTQKNLTIEKIN